MLDTTYVLGDGSETTSDGDRSYDDFYDPHAGLGSNANLTRPATGARGRLASELWAGGAHAAGAGPATATAALNRAAQRLGLGPEPEVTSPSRLLNSDSVRCKGAGGVRVGLAK